MFAHSLNDYLLKSRVHLFIRLFICNGNKNTWFRKLYYRIEENRTKVGRRKEDIVCTHTHTQAHTSATEKVDVMFVFNSPVKLTVENERKQQGESKERKYSTKISNITHNYKCQQRKKVSKCRISGVYRHFGWNRILLNETNTTEHTPIQRV